MTLSLLEIRFQGVMNTTDYGAVRDCGVWPDLTNLMFLIFLHSLVVPKFSLLRNLHTFNSGTKPEVRFLQCKTTTRVNICIQCVIILFNVHFHYCWTWNIYMHEMFANFVISRTFYVRKKSVPEFICRIYMHANWLWPKFADFSCRDYFMFYSIWNVSLYLDKSCQQVPIFGEVTSHH